MDLVAHCRETTKGQYLNTLTATDIATGWTECFLLRQRNQLSVTAAMDSLRQRLPFPLLGIDSGNDGVFINGTLKRYCEASQITFTHSRPCKKNDQAWVEQKNGIIVLGTVGYRRYVSPQATQLLEAIYADLHAFINFFQPMQKLVEKQRLSAKPNRRYDKARTPHNRVMAEPAISPLCKLRLQHQYRQSIRPNSGARLTPICDDYGSCLSNTYFEAIRAELLVITHK